MNRKLFFRIYDRAYGNEKLGKAAVLLTLFSKYIYMAFYGLGFLILLCSNIFYAPRYILVPFAVLVVNTALRTALNKPRPFVRENIEALAPHEENGSLPSNHAASAMIIAFSWLCIEPVVAAMLMILALFTGLSRVMTGLHYPLDILCGWLIAIIGGVTGFLLL